MRNALSLGATALLALTIAACQPAQETGTPAASDAPGATASTAPTEVASSDTTAFTAIAPDEIVRFVGTEPFWGGTVSNGELNYSTPENQDGDMITVRRFAGNNGLGFSGTYRGASFDMTVTPGSCSDGMSDRTFPFTVTLKLGTEQRNGCAWTDRTPFSGSANP